MAIEKKKPCQAKDYTVDAVYVPRGRWVRRIVDNVWPLFYKEEVTFVALPGMHWPLNSAPTAVQRWMEGMKMAKITKNICDRCGKPIKYSGWTAFIAKPQKIKIRQILNGNPSGYNYTDYDIELCKDCTRALDKFIFGERREGE